MGRIAPEGNSLGPNSGSSSFSPPLLALVTGATGFIGSHLVESLVQKGFTVRALMREQSNLRWLKGVKVEWAKSDLTIQDFDPEILKGVDYVFHLAGIISAPSRRDYFEINVEGTRRLAEAAKRSRPGLRKFIFASSQAAGGPSQGEKGVREDDPPHPVSHYGESKLAAEKVMLDFAREFPLVILRPPTIYGPRETRIFAAFQMMNRGIALAAGSGSKFISFCYVSDLVDALLAAAFEPQPTGRIYNVAGERPCEWSEFVETTAKALRKSYRLYRVPRAILFLLGAGGEVYSRLTRRSTLFTWQKVKEFVQNSWVIDGSRIRKELGWREKMTLEEGMARTAAWYRENSWL